MSRPGLFRSLRELFSEMRTFGNPELENLKRQAVSLQRELDELEAMRAAREKQEEALALMHAQNTVQNLQQMERIVDRSRAMIADAVEKASAETDKKVKAMLHLRAQEVMSKLDLSKALSLDSSPEQILADAMQQAEAQLQADDTEASLAQSGTSTLGASQDQGSQDSNTSHAASNLSACIQHQQKRQLHIPYAPLLRRPKLLHRYTTS